MEEKKKIFVVYNLQRFGGVQLIKGFTDKEVAEKTHKSLEKKDDRKSIIYFIGEIEIDENIQSEMKEILEALKCPSCGSYFSFRTVIDYKRFDAKAQCSKCLEELSINIEVKEIKRSE